MSELRKGQTIIETEDLSITGDWNFTGQANFNVGAGDVDFRILQNGGGDAFIYDAGSNLIDVNVDTYFANNLGIGKIPTAKVDIVNDVPGINDPGFVMKSVSAITGNSNTLRLDTTDVDDQNVIQFYKAGFVSWQFVGRNQIDIPNDRFSIFDNSTIEVFTILQGGNVGVGTDVPNKNLVVSSVDDTTLQIQRTDAVTVGDQTTLEFSHTADMLARIQSHLPGGLDVDLRFYTTDNDVINTTPVMTLSGNNYVGVGTTVPEEHLHVYKSTSYPIIKVQSGVNTARTGAIRFAQENESAYEVGMDGSDTGDAAEGLYIESYLSGTPENIAFALQDFNDRAWFRDGLSLGIGTTTPGHSLHVNGDGYFVNELGVGIAPTAQLDIYKDNAIQTLLAQFKENSNDSNIVYDCGANKEIILKFLENGSPKYYQRLQNDAIIFNNEIIPNVLYMSSNGKVGIGTNNPNTKLHNTGGYTRNITTVASASYDLLITDDILDVTYTATGAVTIDLKTAQVVRGRTIVVKDGGFNATTNNITITTEGIEKIDNQDTAVIDVDDAAITIFCDGTNWKII